MASRPLLHHLCKQIEAAGGDEHIFMRLASGEESVREIMEDFINPETGKPFTRAMIYYWKDMTPERQRQWRMARSIQAHSLMEDAETLLEAASKDILTPADVSLLKERVGFKQYLAERFNREEYGKAPEQQTNVTLDLGGAFLAALRQHGNAHRLNAGPAQEALPAEIVEEDDLSDLLLEP